ncbi:hypothetical protein [Pandoraea iniqua]|uniref:hypothetical protein n=1 Tax=Pandoraea iniqua TaxID=2508288 RepID=UPI00158425F6|nr:hypothetical protein [Pandoraea iniqua]
MKSLLIVIRRHLSERCPSGEDPPGHPLCAIRDDGGSAFANGHDNGARGLILEVNDTMGFDVLDHGESS